MLHRRLALGFLLATSVLAQTPAPVQQGDLALREAAFGAENQGRFGDAADAFLRLVQAQPDRAEWVVAAGRCLGRAGRFRDAIDLLDKARTTFPAVPDVPAMLARTFLLKADLDPAAMDRHQLWVDAADMAESVLRIDANHEDCRLVLAQARYLLGDWDEAVKQAEEAVSRHPQRPGAHILIGRIALDRFSDLLQRFSETRLEGAAAAEVVGAIDQQRQRARSAFERAAALDPNRAHPHVMLARLEDLDHHDAEVRRHLLDALAIDPDVAIDHGRFDRDLDWSNRRDAYRSVRERYAAKPDARPAKIGTLLWYEAKALYEGHQWEPARTAFEEALAKNPGATNSHYYAAICAFQLGDHDGAEAHAAAYAAAGPNVFADVVRNLQGETRGQLAAILQFLADRAFQNKRVERSRDLNHVLAYLLDAADSWNNYALLCRDTKRFEDAIEAYQRALEKEPDSPQLLNDLAVVLHQHVPTPEHLRQARGMYERAIALADKQLAEPSLSPTLRQRIQQARDDARANLADMK